MSDGPWPAGTGETAERIRAHDWASTRLGPVEGWPASLKHFAELTLAAPFASVLLWGPQHIVAAYNAGYRTILNEKPEALGKPVLEVWPEVRELLAPQLARVLAGETLSFAELPMSLKRGFESDESWFDYGYGPVRDETGAVAGIIVTINEITHWRTNIQNARESEARQAFLLELSDALRPLANPEAIRYEACRLLAKRLDVDRAYYVEIDEARGAAQVARDFVRDGVPSLTGPHRLADYGWSIAILRRGESYAISDTQVSDLVPEAERPASAALQLIANLAIPLIKDARLVGALCLSDSGPRDWSKVEVDLVREVGERIWAAAEQARAEAAQRASEGRYRTLFDAIDSGFCVIEMIFDETGRAIDYLFVEANPAFERQSGLVDAVGRRIREFAPDLEEQWFERYGRVALSGEPMRVEGEVAPLGRWFDINAFRVGAPEQRRVAVLFTDITARKQSDDVLRESEARLAAAFESVPAGVAVIDRSGATVTSNMEYRRFLPSGRIPSRDTVRSRWRAWDSEGRPLEPNEFPGARALRGETVVPGQEMLYTDDDGREFWTAVATAPIRDEAGQVTGAATVISDIDAAKRQVEALRESEQRFREFGENSSDALWIYDLEADRLEYLSPAFEHIWGESRQTVLESVGRWAEMLHPDDRAVAAQGMPRLRSGERHNAEYRIVRPDGRGRWIRDAGFPIPDAAGTIVKAGGIAQDITDRRAMEEALLEGEQRFRGLVEGIPQLVWRARDYGLWTWASPQWTAYTGQSNEDSWGWGWLDPVHPDDRMAARAAWQHARETGGFQVEYRVRNVQLGRYVWFATRAVPVYAQDGGILEWLGTSTDIDELRMLQQRQQLLLAELQHRVRNTLGVIKSVARRTAESSETVDELAAHLDGRIEAFARVQAAVTRDPQGGVDLKTLIEDELLAHATREGRNLEINGPALLLKPRAAEAISLAFHELTTNAVKHGTIGLPDGRLIVRWRVEDGSFRLSWKESGLSEPPKEPNGDGFGMELLLQSLPYDLDAETQVAFEPTGLRFTMEAPAKSLLH